MGIQSRNLQASTKSIKMSPFLFLTLLIIGASARGRGAARENCDCQCSSLAYRDENGIQGNCKSKGLMPTGRMAEWCFVDENNDLCNDLVPSEIFTGKYWSYEACTSPSSWEPECNPRRGGRNPNRG